MIDDVLGKLVADKYRVETLIREGDSGDLFAARHEVMDRPVTMLILPQALAVDGRWVKRFIDQARAASAISHPNVLNLTDFGTDAKGVTYAVFDEIEGRVLRDAMSGEVPFDAVRSLDIAKSVASAVSAAHAKRAISGRLGPDNIFIGEDDSVRVFGFGGDPMHVERDAEPQYLAPEQLSSFPAADERSDVYSLGILLYEMITGVVPYDGATAADVVSKQNTEPPPPLSAFNRDIHSEIEPILLTAIAADPLRRYQTMEAFAEDLEILSSRVGSPPKAAVASAATAGMGRNPWKTAVFALAGIFVLAVALIYATSVRQTDPTTQLQADAGSLPVQPIGPATGAQEESLVKLPVMTDAEIMAAQTAMEMPGALPGGDGYNAWANGGAPPPGAPLQQPYFPPGGQIYTIDGQGSQFMPQDGGVILVPVPMANTNTAPKTETTTKTPANAVPKTGAETSATPKPMATPPPKNPAASSAPKKNTPATKPPASKPEDIEELP